MQPKRRVVATNAATFGATGLPGGLAINSGTGAITGTPTVGGQFAVVITATDATVGVSDIETLTLTIAIPTPTGTNAVVAPVVPEGQGPGTMTFGEITTAGTTTVSVVEQSAVPAPGNVAIGGVVYEVTTTASYTGMIQLCFSYAGIDFGATTPRLFHTMRTTCGSTSRRASIRARRRSVALPPRCRPLQFWSRTSSAPGSTRP